MSVNSDKDGNVLYLATGGSVTSQVCDLLRRDILTGSLTPDLKLKIEAPKGWLNGWTSVDSGSPAFQPMPSSSC